MAPPRICSRTAEVVGSTLRSRAMTCKQGCSIRRRPHEIVSHLDRRREPSLGGDGRDALYQERKSCSTAGISAPLRMRLIVAA